MLIEDYFQRVGNAIAGSSIVQASQVTYDKRTTYIGYIRGTIQMIDGSVLHFREFIDTEIETDRYTYAYHYQRDDTLIFRYDNTEHHRKPNLPTFPNHKHDGSESNVISSDAPSLKDVLTEIEDRVVTSWER